MAQVAQRGCPMFTFGDTQNLTVHRPEQPTVADAAQGRALDWMLYKGACKPQQHCDSVIL